MDDAVLTDFKAFLKSKDVEYTDADLSGVSDWLKANIKYNLFTSQFGQSAGLRVLKDWDPQIAKAITFIPEAQALEDHAKSNVKTASIR